MLQVYSHLHSVQYIACERHVKWLNMIVCGQLQMWPGSTCEAVRHAGEQHDVAGLQLRLDALSVERPDPAGVHVVDAAHHAAALAVHPVAIDRLRMFNMKALVAWCGMLVPAAVPHGSQLLVINVLCTGGPLSVPHCAAAHLHGRPPPHAGAAAVVPAQHLRRQRLHHNKCSRWTPGFEAVLARMQGDTSHPSSGSGPATCRNSHRG